MKGKAERSHVSARNSIAGAARVGVLAGLLAVLVAGGVLAYLRLSGEPVPFVQPREMNEVLVVAALPDENGDVVAQVIADVDLVRGVVACVDPATTVTIPGTTYSALRDVYPFGGGGGVARAVAGIRDAEPARWIALESRAIARAFEGGARLEVRLDEPMAVFDGERLYEFPAGTVSVASVSDLRAMLNGAAYLSASVRQRVLSDVARGLVRIVASYPGGVGEAIAAGVVESDLTPEEADSMAKRIPEPSRE